MVKPTQPKAIKPKAESIDDVAAGAGGGGLNGTKLLMVNTTVTVLICLLFVASNYFIVQSTIAEAVKHVSAGQQVDEEGEHGDEEAVERGLILDLGEFILNLSDPRAKRYLKINVALELTKKESDPDPHAAAGGGGGHGGGHGGGGADPMKQIEMEMNQFKPAIRDSVISILSSKTAEELSNTAGKDLAKEQIKEAVNAVFAGEREVLRVSFGNFIIQ